MAAATPNTPKKFVRLAREQRVSAILSAALAVFSERGYEAAAVSEIAERAGVVEGTVYKYFESKRALLLTVMEQWYEGMVEDYTRDLAGIVGSRQRLRFIIWRHLRTIIDNPQLCRLLFREVRSELDYYDLDLHGSIRRYSKFIMDIIEEGVRADEFRSDVPLPLLRDMVFGCIEHRTWNYISGRGDLNIDETVDQIMSILCDGIVRASSANISSLSDSGAYAKSGLPIEANLQTQNHLQQETERLAALVARLEKLLAKSESVNNDATDRALEKKPIVKKSQSVNKSKPNKTALNTIKSSSAKSSSIKNRRAS